jgi:hypothetical protein
MKIGWRNLLLFHLLFALAAVGQAWANDEPKDRRLRLAIERAERQIPPQQNAAERGAPGTLLNRMVPANRTVPANPDEAQTAARLSQDERRALRRQINDAGRELYPPPSKASRGP